MKTGDLVELAARNLRESVLRNSLTTVGISVGVASLVAMLSLGIGLQHLAASRLAKSGLFDSIYVTSGRRMQGPNGRMERRKGPPPPLDEPARQKMARFTEVSEVYPDIRFPAEVRLDSPSNIEDPPAQEPSSTKSESGNTTESGERSGRSSMLLGERSEEHTSELQSLRHLVCRLLLEKKRRTRN